MAVNLTNADSALKSYYLDAICEQLNKKANPFLAAIKHSTENVYGKEVRKFTTFGINGGIGAGTEDGNLPKAAGNNYAQMVSTLKNLYGTIEISDKAIRASENNSGAFISLLNAEMEGLVKSSALNFGRMLFGDGQGFLCETLEPLDDGSIPVDEISGLFEGMIVEFTDSYGEPIPDIMPRRVVSVDRSRKTFKVDGSKIGAGILYEGAKVVVQGSFGNEITGLKAIFSKSTNLYGLERANNPWLNPYAHREVGDISETVLQTALDDIESNSGSSVNFIICSFGVRRSLQALFATNKRSLDTMELAGGFKAMSYNGIPIVADRFCPEGTMYLLNTDDFALHQLCDWQWMEGDDGRVLKQIPGKPVYSATLVKYAELLCYRPKGQGMLAGIVEI